VSASQRIRLRRQLAANENAAPIKGTIGPPAERLTAHRVRKWQNMRLIIPGIMPNADFRFLNNTSIL
jgi:hypothetical protein